MTADALRPIIQSCLYSRNLVNPTMSNYQPFARKAWSTLLSLGEFTTDQVRYDLSPTILFSRWAKPYINANTLSAPYNARLSAICQSKSIDHRTSSPTLFCSYSLRSSYSTLVASPLSSLNLSFSFQAPGVQSNSLRHCLNMAKKTKWACQRLKNQQ